MTQKEISYNEYEDEREYLEDQMEQTILPSRKWLIASRLRHLDLHYELEPDIFELEEENNMNWTEDIN